MIRRHIQIFLTLISATFLLNACCSLNSEFECPMKPGIRCESLDQVNARIDRGEIGRPPLSSTPCCGKANNLTPTPVAYKNEINIGKREPLRYGETVMRVWVAPYEDTAGNYHQESDIYTVVKPSHWIGFPPKESNEEEG